MSRSNLLRLGLRVGYCRVTVTLAPATLDVLALALLDGQQDTRQNTTHHTQKHTEVAQRKGLHIHLGHKSMGRDSSTVEMYIPIKLKGI